MIREDKADARWQEMCAARNFWKSLQWDIKKKKNDEMLGGKKNENNAPVPFFAWGI